MSGFTTGNVDHVIRSQIWTGDLKEVLQDELEGTKYVRMLTDFPDGDTFNIPSIGQLEVADYVEGQPVRYTAMDTGNFQFSITDYKQSATFMTNKFMQDSMWAGEIMASFVPKQARAIMSEMEAKIMALGPDGQTASNSNTINGGKHRYVATGTNARMTVKEFSQALFALKKANVPQQNLIAIVDPSVEFEMNNISNITNVSNNPRWEGIIASGMASGPKFLANIFGFDVYTSNYLKTGMTETIDARSVTGDGVANLFFSATSDVLPFVGAVRQAPKVDSEYNKDLQREEYVTTMRYGLKLFRPENMVVVLSSTGQVYA